MLRALPSRHSVAQIFPYDLHFVKQLERRNRTGLAWRVLMLVLCGAVGFVALDEVAFLFWGGSYALGVITWLGVLRAVPDKVGPGYLAFAGVIALLYGVSYVWIGWYAWMSPDPVMRYAGIIVMMSVMVNALSMRSDDLLMSVTDVVLMLCSSIWLITVSVLREDNLAETLFFAVVVAALNVYAILSVRDSNRARAKLRQASRAELDQAKMQAMGQLTGGVAHDFNNLLTVIIGNLELQQQDGIAAEDREELLAEVEGAARKASVLTQQLLSFSRRSPLAPRQVEVCDVLRSAQVLLRRLLPATHALEISGAHGLPPIRVDVAQLETVIVNLAMNSRDAMPTGGTVAISASLVAFPQGRDFVASDTELAGRSLAPGKYLRLSVADTGTGIEPRVLAQVLEPYYTTKPVGKGSGLGLSMALGFAEQTGGTLSIASRPGHGTRVVLWLPVDPQAQP